MERPCGFDYNEGMAPVVMKFGGSSVADPTRLRKVAALVAARAATQPVVVVVSAMGKTTDGLVKLAREVAKDPDPRELDMLLTTGERHAMAMLALAVRDHGRRAISLTGSQVGIVTDHRHGGARIVEVRPFRILDEFAAGHDVVIVGGFQGVSYRRELTTLGRGGSDTTAVALAAALRCDCEIYSDVDGVYSGDPRLLPEAQHFDELDPVTMQSLSRAGAKVLHARAIELAEAQDIVVYARATEGGGETRITRRAVASRGVVAVVCEPVTTVNLGARHSHDANAASTSADAPSTDPLRWLGAVSELGLRNLTIGRRGLTGHVSIKQRDDVPSVVTALRALAEAEDLDCEITTGERFVLVGSGLEDRPGLLTQLASLVAEAIRGTTLVVGDIAGDERSIGVVLHGEVDDTTRGGLLAALHRAFVAPSR